MVDTILYGCLAKGACKQLFVLNLNIPLLIPDPLQQVKGIILKYQKIWALPKNSTLCANINSFTILILITDP